MECTNCARFWAYVETVTTTVLYASGPWNLNQLINGHEPNETLDRIAVAVALQLAIALLLG